MNTLNNPPNSNRVIIIVAKTENNKILASSFRYKRNKWVGTASGTSLLTEEFPSDAIWIECPVQI